MTDVETARVALDKRQQESMLHFIIAIVAVGLLTWLLSRRAFLAYAAAVTKRPHQMRVPAQFTDDDEEDGGGVKGTRRRR